jgi:hypothetical protein
MTTTTTERPAAISVSTLSRSLADLRRVEDWARTAATQLAAPVFADELKAGLYDFDRWQAARVDAMRAEVIGTRAAAMRDSESARPSGTVAA